jgi:hypothetical protein
MDDFFKLMPKTENLPLIMALVVAGMVLERIFHFLKQPPEEEIVLPPAEPPKVRSVCEIGQVTQAPVAPKTVRRVVGNPDDMVISGDVPIIGEEDVHQSKTQPIPTVGMIDTIDATITGGGATGYAQPLQVQDHILQSFYEKLYNPKNYDLSWLSADDPPKRFGRYIAYDTVEIHTNAIENNFFVSGLSQPYGTSYKTRLETNVYGYGMIGTPHEHFIFSATIVRFEDDVDPDYLRKMAFFELHDQNSYRTPVAVPLSSFVPLNPFDQKPRVFFHVHEQIVVRMACMTAKMSFPKGLGLTAPVHVRIELVGITVSCN